MNARATRVLTVMAASVLAASISVGQAAGKPGGASSGPRFTGLPGTAHGSVLTVTSARQSSPIQAALPLEVAILARGSAGQPLTGTTTPSGYSAAQLQAYLGLHGDGTAQTVAIVDAFDDPTITSDVNTYSQQFGLPRVCGTSGAGSDCFSFTVRAPDGTAGTDSGWGLETALDVEMVHAIAPHAAVVLMEGHDNGIIALWSAVDHAASMHPAVISNSWDETLFEQTGETTLDHHCQLARSLCVFSSGDSSNPANYPATSPDVLSIGGTNLQLSSGGAVTSETAWGCIFCGHGSGGGISYIEPRPIYQHAVNPSAFRGVPDVSFDADPHSGVAVFDSDGISGQWLKIGGTSVGAPAWSAVLAVADQLRATAGKPLLAAAHFAAQRAIYSLRSGLADITQGTTGPAIQSSNYAGLACGPQCQAGPGYDYVTGLGSPRPGIDTALAAAP